MLQEELVLDDFSEAAATFGDRLTAAREAAGLTQEQLARRLGVRASAIRNWEADRSEPRANRLQMLAGFLGVSMVWLLTGEGEGAPPATAGEAPAVDAEIGALLAEIRELRLANLRANQRLARIERRLREMSAGA